MMTAGFAATDLVMAGFVTTALVMTALVTEGFGELCRIALAAIGDIRNNYF